MKSRDAAEPGIRSEVGAVFGLRVQPLATSGLLWRLGVISRV